MELWGTVIVDKKTKDLVKRLCPGQIAIISHPDLDEIAAQSLIEAGAKAVLNASSSITGLYPNKGPEILLKAGVPLIDDLGTKIMFLKDNEKILIKNERIYLSGNLIGSGCLMTKERLQSLIATTKKNLEFQLNSFIENTVNYIALEKNKILQRFECPNIRTKLQGKTVVIVIRGHGYKEDLNALRSFIYHEKPVLIGVDGGADALLEIGYPPDIIIGDMDSISDYALYCGAELIVHAYPDGEAPAIERLKKMDLDYTLFPAFGTSEDIAMLLAHEKGADLHVAVGTHSNMIDFLEKGRKGMSSTFLVRLKVGPKLIDAKGVSKLYRPKLNSRNLWPIFIAGFIPVAIIILISPVINQFFKILLLQLRLIIKL